MIYTDEMKRRFEEIAHKDGDSKQCFKIFDILQFTHCGEKEKREAVC